MRHQKLNILSYLPIKSQKITQFPFCPHKKVNRDYISNKQFEKLKDFAKNCQNTKTVYKNILKI